MATNSVFREVIEFFGQLGVYDVLLPFLLTFVIFLAILEKTKVFGTEKVNGEQMPKKSLNAMVAFVVGFLVVGSSHIVALINIAVAQVMVLLIIGVLFMMLIGAMHEDGKYKTLDKKYMKYAVGFFALGIILIFMNAIKLNSNVSVLEFVYSYVINNASGTVVGTALLLVILVGGMIFITKDKTARPAEKEEGE